ncbi:MAG: nitroreductase family protein [Prevotellaceae bacterium]|jgi:nitroreductase|nr:nitroreductase family protein [Prevotellaceae bacterium]
MKDTLTVIHERTSVRHYTPQPVTDADIETLLRAAMAAPTSKNKQPWRFVVVSQETAKHTLAAHLPYAAMLRDAPLAIVVCGDTRVHTDESAISWVMDCAAATENLLLAAQAINLGAVWTGVYPYPDRIQTVQHTLQLPAHIIPLNIVAIGHPAKPARPKDKWNPTKIQRIENN